MKYYHKLYLALLGFILILTPTFNFGLESFYNEKRMAEGVVLVIGSVIFLSILYRNKINIPKWLSYSALLFFGFLFIEAILFSKYFNWALLEIGWYVSLVQLIFVLVYFQVLKPDSMQKLLMIAVYCLAFIYCFKVAETVIQSHLDPEWPIWPRVVKYKLLINGEIFGPNPFLGFSNFRFLNHLHTWSIPIMIGGYLKYNKNLILGFKILSIITLSAWWSLIFASDARGTTLGLLVSLLVIVYSYRREAKDYILYFVLTACAGLIIYFVGFQLFHETGGRTILTRSGDSGRIEVWGTTIQYIIQNPMFGLSPMHFSDIQNSIKFSSPHNMYLLWAAEWGIPALIILLAGAATLFRKWIKYSRENVTNFNISLTASLTAVLVHSNVSGIFISPLSQLLGCFVVAIMLGIYIKDNDVILFSPHNDFKFTRKLMIGGVLIFNIATYSIAISQMSELAESRDQFMIDREETILYPRFWDQGFIDNN